MSSRAQPSEHGVPYVRCVQGEGTGWESAFPASLTGSGSYGSSLGGVKVNAVGLDVMGSPTKKIISQ